MSKDLVVGYTMKTGADQVDLEREDAAVNPPAAEVKCQVISH